MNRKKDTYARYLGPASIYIDPESGLEWGQGEAHQVDEPTAARLRADAPDSFAFDPRLPEPKPEPAPAALEVERGEVVPAPESKEVR